MQERSFFRALARVVGLVLIAIGVGDILGAGLTEMGVQSSRVYSALDRLGAGCVYLATGFVMILAAGAITRLLYGQEAGPD